MGKGIYAVFVAGGSGTRMGSSTPKQFLDLAGTPVLLRTINRFVETIPELHVIVVLPHAHFQTWRDICKMANFVHPQYLVKGGITRFHSVKNALEKVPEDSVVLIHDGVRPMVSSYLIQAVVKKVQEGHCVIPVTPITDTIKSLVPSEVEGEYKESGELSPDRSLLFGAQTPQGFPSSLLKEAYDTCFESSFTDDASVLSKKNIPLTYIKGERYNIKITTPEDLAFLDSLFS